VAVDCSAVLLLVSSARVCLACCSGRVFGGMAGFASIFGLLLQFALIVIVARLIYAWWQRRNMSLAPSYAAARPATGHSFSGLGGMLHGTGRPPEPVAIARPTDTFERMLGEIQSAYSREDLSALRAWVLPRCCPISPSSWRTIRAGV
jgi:predicted lipid-binding transport protein (Tim44 family)